MNRLARLARIRRRQRQIAAARLQQHQALAHAQAQQVTQLQAAVRHGRRAGELEVLMDAAAGAAAALEVVHRGVRDSRTELTRRAFAQRRAEQMLAEERDRDARTQARRDQQAMDDRFARRTG